MKLVKAFPLRMKLFPIISIFIVLGLSITPLAAQANEDDPNIPGPVPLITEIEINVDGERLEEIVIPVLFYNEEEKGMILGGSGNNDEVIRSSPPLPRGGLGGLCYPLKTRKAFCKRGRGDL